MTVDAVTECPAVLFESFSSGAGHRSFSFKGFVGTVSASSPDQVRSAFREIEEAVAAGLHAAGFVSYEAASACNPALPSAPPGELPLVWFALFRERQEITPAIEEITGQDGTISEPTLEITGERYIASLKEIRGAIARGETYQVNFTARQLFSIDGDPFRLYRRICRNQKAPYSAFLDIGSHQILSASPELFFSLKEGILTMRPMKGTAPRLPRGDHDRLQAERLKQSAKDRAENLMIVDLVRNDLATIAETGSVRVPSLFDVETYPTVHQMTSTVTARIRPGIGVMEIFGALFPCGSVTGAPKRRTMQIINALEDSPRGLYCGAIGYLSPGGEATFSVAIRTAIVDTVSGRGELGIGSGVTWDSDPAAEFDECLVKGAFLTREVDRFRLIESLRHDGNGYLLLERHLERLAESAAYFGFSCDTGAVASGLSALGKTLRGVCKVRLLLDEEGRFGIDAETLTEPAPGPLPVIAISDERIDPSDPFLYHKTTRRTLYERELENHPGCYDVVFLNEREELTEGSFNTLAVSLGGELLTPALDCGLLPGVLRAELLDIGALREAVLTLDDLHRADRIWLVNSVRGWRECGQIKKRAGTRPAPTIIYDHTKENTC